MPELTGTNSNQQLELGGASPLAKAGQQLPPQLDTQHQVQAVQQQAPNLTLELLQIPEAVEAWKGMMTPEEAQDFAATAAFGIIPGGGEAAPLERAGAKALSKGALSKTFDVMPQLAARYPEAGEKVLMKKTANKADKIKMPGYTREQGEQLVKEGKAYWAKGSSKESELTKKIRGVIQTDIDNGIYKAEGKPYFDVANREDVDYRKYPAYQTTTDLQPKTQATIDKYVEHATNPEGVKRLVAAFEHGQTIPNSGNWYFLRQLEHEFIDELGEQEGRQMFRRRVAEALAATTGGMKPKDNLMMANYMNYLEAMDQQLPADIKHVPFPVGGRYMKGNIKQIDKRLAGQAPYERETNPKRYNFEKDFLGESRAGTIDEVMSQLWEPGRSKADPGMTQPEFYGPYQQALNDLAAMHNVDPRYFQEVAWSGAKAMKDPAYKAGKPMIQEYNEAIERTARITGLPPREVVRKGIVRGELPLYGVAGVLGVGGLDEAAQQLEGQ